MKMSLFLILSFTVSVLCSNFNTLLEQEVSVAAFSQKTLSLNSTIDKIPLIGLNLSSTVFSKYGYNSSSVSFVSTSYKNPNLNALMIDLFWYDNIASWHLCPSLGSGLSNDSKLPIHVDGGDLECDVTLSLIDLLKVITLNTTSGPGYVPYPKQIIFNLKLPFDNSNATYFNPKISKFSSVSSQLVSVFGDRLYKPKEYENENNLYPSLYEFFHSHKKSVISMIWNNQLTSNSSFTLDSETGIFKTQPSSSFQINYKSTLTEPLEQLNQQSWKFTMTISSFDNLRSSMLKGCTSFINYENLSFTDINFATWQWARNQPLTSTQAKNMVKHNSFPLSVTPRLLQAFQCAALYNGAWVTENCYEVHFVACQSRDDIFDWQITSNKKSYFDAGGSCVDVPGDFNFSLPKSGLVQQYLINYAAESNISEPIWIDYNSIATNSCWVSGGPDALCPYIKIDHNSRFVQMVTPICVFILFVFSLILITNSQKVPVQKNRKYWKNLVAEFTKDEFEGVAA